MFGPVCVFCLPCQAAVKRAKASGLDEQDSAVLSDACALMDCLLRVAALVDELVVVAAAEKQAAADQRNSVDDTGGAVADLSKLAALASSAREAGADAKLDVNLARADEVIAACQQRVVAQLSRLMDAHRRAEAPGTALPATTTVETKSGADGGGSGGGSGVDKDDDDDGGASPAPLSLQALEAALGAVKRAALPVTVDAGADEAFVQALEAAKHMHARMRLRQRSRGDLHALLERAADDYAQPNGNQENGDGGGGGSAATAAVTFENFESLERALAAAKQAGVKDDDPVMLESQTKLSTFREEAALNAAAQAAKVDPKLGACVRACVGLCPSALHCTALVGWLVAMLPNCQH